VGIQLTQDTAEALDKIYDQFRKESD
jgi:hypothetical protein